MVGSSGRRRVVQASQGTHPMSWVHSGNNEEVNVKGSLVGLSGATSRMRCCHIIAPLVLSCTCSRTVPRGHGESHRTHARRYGSGGDG